MVFFLGEVVRMMSLDSWTRLAALKIQIRFRHSRRFFPILQTVTFVLRPDMFFSHNFFGTASCRHVSPHLDSRINVCININMIIFFSESRNKNPKSWISTAFQRNAMFMLIDLEAKYAVHQYRRKHLINRNLAQSLDRNSSSSQVTARVTRPMKMFSS